MEHNDFELVDLAKDHNEEAIKTIYEKYKPIILGKANFLYGTINHRGIDLNDLIQEGYIGLDKAINSFKEDNNVTFYTFASKCIERQIIGYIRKSSNKRQKVLNEAITIDDGMEHILKDSLDIENNFIDKEDNKNIVDKLKSDLSEFERNVLDYRLKGYNMNEIAKITNKDIKVIYNTFDRIKYKLKKIIRNN